MAKRVPQEPGRPRRFHRDFRLGNRKTNSPEPPVARRRPKGANIRRIGGIGRAKATKRGEMDGGESERLIVPLRPGNRSEGTRRREGDAVSGHRWRETWRVLRNPWRCSRNDNGSRNSEERASEMTSQIREIRTSGSVGARGEQSPRATRPYSNSHRRRRLPDGSRLGGSSTSRRGVGAFRAGGRISRARRRRPRRPGAGRRARTSRHGLATRGLRGPPVPGHWPRPRPAARLASAMMNY